MITRDGFNAVWPVLTAVAVVAGLVAAGIGVLSLADALTATGLPDPGPVTTVGLPFVRAAGEIAAAVAVGGFLFAAFLVPPQTTGVLDAAGYRAVRMARGAALVWAACAALLVPLTISDVSGEPLREHLDPVAMWRIAGLVDTADAWRWTALLALFVAVAASPVLRWSTTPVLLAGAVMTLIPLGLTGHSAAGGSHDLAANSLLIHLVAGALWAGGLLALLAYTLRADALRTDKAGTGTSGDHQFAGLAARRFSAVALCCYLAMALSGIINALIRMRPADLFTTPYGWLVAAKIAALGALGLIGWRQRRVAVTALQSDPAALGPLLRLSLTEALVFGVAFGVAVGLGRTPPPPPVLTNPSPVEVAIGYDLGGPPTLARILLDWRFDLLFGSAAIIVAVLYLAAVMRLRRRGAGWSPGRSFAWLLGCALLLFTTSSGLGRYMPTLFSMHMTAHLLLSMLIPLLLVLGAPTTLASRALPAAGEGNPPGPREWLQAGLHSRWLRFFAHPVVATVMFVGGFWVLYFGGIFDVAVSNHPAHILMNLYFLLSGYQFYWAVIGVDPPPRALPTLGKIGMVFAAIALQVLLGVTLMGVETILGERFYRSLLLPWHTDLLGDQHVGGFIAGAAGVMPLVVVLMALLIQRRRNPAAAH